MRLCLDPRPLNECIKRDHFLIPTVEDLTVTLSQSKVFSVLDLKSGFWHMELDKESADLTTFMPPFGKFKWNRVPFGISCPPELFQSMMVKIFGDIPGVIIYFDDCLVAAAGEEEHDAIVEKVLERARANNVKFNSKKLQYKQSEVEFMGNIITGNGTKPLKKYRDAMKRPEDKGAVDRFLGLVKYISRIVPNRTQITTHLRELLRADRKFEWKGEQEKEFALIKSLIMSDKVLALFDPEKEMVVQTDASKFGLGCVLMQEGRPVAFACRTLSASEVKYAQIEKEMLAITFACDRFHFYLYGREFVVESDHQPLEALMKKDSHSENDDESSEDDSGVQKGERNVHCRLSVQSSGVRR